ncbi:signal-regulatory protein beta-2-like [Astatotilapia calliptera]|uniref:signal-regulatory protein beta-2-like n=1 Tax=Astatotilapia calliptera TaxID=8154 RepID=UPI000E41987C|nr:signal-regulatory protein beta-2-like [Astatotilapia calliptera]
MIVLWVTLLLLHQGYTLVPVTSVQLGETVTIPCQLPVIETIRKEVHWYKQRAGDTLKVIWTMRESATPEFAPEFNNSRLKVNHNKHFTNLTILKTNQEDEGIYHCGFTEWRRNTEWTGTYLLVKGNTQKTSNYTFVKEKVHPGDSVTLQCSVLSSSNRKTCPGGHNVFWFREANTSHPGIIYTAGNRHHECEKRSETEQSCVYRLSKNISSSDSGTYYCAVATCGEILFGNGTKLDSRETRVWSQTASSTIFLLCTVLAISLIVIVALIWMIKKNSDHCRADIQRKCFTDQKKQENKDTWMFSVVVFTTMKVDGCTKKYAKPMKKEQIYTAAEAFVFG